MSFHGGEFKSYSTAIARFHTAPGGERVVLLNTRKYSNTTTGHQSAVRRAIPDTVPQFRADTDAISSPLAFVQDCIQVAEKRLQWAAETRQQSPRKKKYIAECEAAAAHHLTTGKEAAELFNLSEFSTYPWHDHAAVLEAVTERAAKEAKEQAALKIKQDRQKKANLKKWLAGEYVPRYNLPDGQAYFRPLPDGGLESTLGVTIPAPEVRPPLAFILSHRHTPWQKNGARFPVAGYELDSITKAGIVAGCHRFTWAEVDRVRSLLKA